MGVLTSPLRVSLWVLVLAWLCTTQTTRISQHNNRTHNNRPHNHKANNLIGKDFCTTNPLFNPVAPWTCLCAGVWCRVSEAGYRVPLMNKGARDIGVMDIGSALCDMMITIWEKTVVLGGHRPCWPQCRHIAVQRARWPRCGF